MPSKSPIQPPPSPTLSASQLATLAEIGEERTAQVGEVLYRVGDRSYPFIAILEGEVAILDAAGNEIVRHGASGFLGELNLLSGQTVFVTAVVTEPLRYIAVDARRAALAPVRGRPAQRPPPLDVHRPARGAAARPGHRPRDRRPALLGSHDADARVRAQQPAAVHLARSRPGGRSRRGGARRRTRRGAACRSCGCPAASSSRRPSTGQVSRALGIGLELAPREEVDLLVVGGGPAGLGAAVYGASEGLDTLVVESTALGGQAGSSRRIENYLGFPAGISGTELTSRAVTQARKFNARTATPYRALSLEPGNGRHLVRLEDDHEIAARAVLLATGAQYRRLPVDGPRRVRGTQRLLRRRPARGPALRRLARRRRRRRQLGRPGRRLARPRRRARDAAPPPRRPPRDDVRLPRPRARALRRRGSRPQRDRRPPRRGRPARGASR